MLSGGPIPMPRCDTITRRSSLPLRGVVGVDVTRELFIRGAGVAGMRATCPSASHAAAAQAAAPSVTPESLEGLRANARNSMLATLRGSAHSPSNAAIPLPDRALPKGAQHRIVSRAPRPFGGPASQPGKARAPTRPPQCIEVADSFEIPASASQDLPLIPGPHAPVLQSMTQVLRDIGASP